LSRVKIPPVMKAVSKLWITVDVQTHR